MRTVICLWVAALLLTIGTGCEPRDGVETYKEVKDSKAYKAIDFARNATNPVYYGKKAVKALRSSKDSKDSTESNND